MPGDVRSLTDRLAPLNAWLDALPRREVLLGHRLVSTWQLGALTGCTLALPLVTVAAAVTGASAPAALASGAGGIGAHMACGRVGCFLHGCCYGTRAGLGVRYPASFPAGRGRRLPV